jgi:Rps23 Pro-64 3,4-dihydroxylase Tpa1-like proline 4-hydroxylase
MSTAEELKNSGYILLKYSSSDFYKIHVDEQSDSQQKRTVSCVICLTDDYIGGEIAFLNKQKIFKLKKGDVDPMMVRYCGSSRVY